jgi:hypothetical protein
MPLFATDQPCAVGLTVARRLGEGDYAKGIQLTDAEMAALPLWDLHLFGRTR